MALDLPDTAREPVTPALLAAAHAGDLAARNAVIMRTMRLVIREAQREARRFPDVDADDLVQAAIAGAGPTTGGLVRAVELWDAKRQRAWSTYAAWWIRAAMRDVTGRTATSGRGATTRRQRVTREAARLRTRLGRAPTTAEVQGACIARGAQAPSASAVTAALACDLRLVPWDEELHAHVGAVETDADAAIDARRRLARLRAALARWLPALDRRVLALAYGHDAMAHAEIAARLGVPMRMVRERASAALATLRVVLDVGVDVCACTPRNTCDACWRIEAALLAARERRLARLDERRTRARARPAHV